MWLDFVGDSRPFSEGFSPGTLVFLSPQKPTFSKFQFDLEKVDVDSTEIPIFYLFFLIFPYHKPFH